MARFVLLLVVIPGHGIPGGLELLGHTTAIIEAYGEHPVGD